MKCFDILEIEKKIEIMDIGAAAIAETPVYKILIDLGLGNLNAFEGDKRQSQKLKDEFGTNIKLFEKFIFDGNEQNLYLCTAESGMTSVLKPAQNALNFFNGFGGTTVEKVEKIKTTKLDDVSELPLIDFAKMDIQGAELTVLKNGTEKLKDCLALQLEVSYISLYEKQPSFGEIDLWMRSQGFVPHCFLDVKRWSIYPTIFNNNFRTPGNQLLESDIVYIKDPLKLHLLSDDQLKKIAIISHYCFQSVDLSGFVFLELEKRNIVPKDSYKQYITNVKKFK